MNFLNELLAAMQPFAYAGGGLLAVWGVIGLGTGLSEQNGAAIQTAVWKIVGGALVIGAGALLTMVTSVTG